MLMLIGAMREQNTANQSSKSEELREVKKYKMYAHKQDKLHKEDQLYYCLG